MPERRQMRSVEASRFAMVPRNDVPRSAFDVSHSHKTTFQSGFLIPVFVDEVLPGDSIRLRMTALARLATAIVPLMDNLILESFFFFVPNRLVWDNWERFMGAQANPTDTTQFLVPVKALNDADVDSLVKIFDYMGLTVNNSANSISVNSLPFRAYNLIWNEWFRDEDLQVKQVVPTDDGPDVGYAGSLLRRGKRFDYFTSARPWPQKPMNLTESGFTGEPWVPGGRMHMPQAGAPVTGIGVWEAAAAPSAGPINSQEAGNRLVTYQNYYDSSNSTQALITRADATTNNVDIRVLINDIRTAASVQQLLERNARGGTRYAEIVRSHFGVISPDSRLQRPEYLGGGRAFISTNPVAQTSATGVTGGTTVLGELAGVASAVAQNHGFSSSFTEHGYILGMVSVRADLSYQQGVERMWWRRTQFDFYWPSLANLGEQAILSKEIFCDGSVSDDLVFGYQERWSEYKYKPSRISGKMRSINSAPLDMWHLSQKFTARPVLNDAFIVENPPLDRVLQVTGNFGQQVFFDSVFDVRYVRPMPMRSIPGIGATLRL